MKKRILSTILTAALFLLVFPLTAVNAAEAPLLSALYNQDRVTVTGDRFADGKYIISVLDSIYSEDPIALGNAEALGGSFEIVIPTGKLASGSYALKAFPWNGGAAINGSFSVKDETLLYTVAVTAGSGGTAFIADGDSTSAAFTAGTQVTLKATANSGYKFSKWTLSGVTASNLTSTEISFTMPANDVTADAAFTRSSSGGGGGGGGSSSGSSDKKDEEEDLKEDDGFAVMLDGAETKVRQNSDGSIELSDENIKDFEGKSFVLSIPLEDADESFAAIMKLDGVDVILPFCTVKDGFVNVLVSKAGTYSAKPNPKSFGDTEGHWAAEYITFATVRELYSGIAENRFGPDGKMTRAMFATVLARLDGADLTGTAAVPFEDVDDKAWYAAAVKWAAENEIVTGLSDSAFAPDAEITREQMAVILSRYIAYKGWTLPESAATETFGDDSEISLWAKNAVAEMQLGGIISGKPGNLFDPKGTATRAEVAAVFTRFISALV